MVVDCNACGASLPIDADTHFVTCVRCAGRLEVKREGDAIRTVERGDEDEAPAARVAGGSVAPPSSTTATSGESILRIVVGVGLIASDLFWWLTEPSMQSLPVRIALLAGGTYLVLSGVVRAARNVRARHPR